MLFRVCRFILQSSHFFSIFYFASWSSNKKHYDYRISRLTQVVVIGRTLFCKVVKISKIYVRVLKDIIP